MGEAIRTHDWAGTPIGPVAGWPQSLRTSVSVCLHSRFPILILWGPELVEIYNDACRPLFGTKQALGRTGRVVWPEVWHVVGPMLTGVLDRGEATWSENQRLLLNRHGYPEECYFTFSYSPIHGESGGIGGVFCAVTETTEQVLRERRSEVIRNLAEHTAFVQTREQALEIPFLALAENPHDVPFALFYRPNEAGTGFQLAAHLRAGNLRTDESAWPLAAISQTGQARLLDEVPFSEKPHPTLPPDSVRQAYVLPVARPGWEQPFGWLVLGVNPHRAFDTGQRHFFESLAGSVAAAFTNAAALEAERRRAGALIEIERARAEAWQQAEARLQNLFMQAPVVIAILGREPDFRFQMVNQAYANIVDRRMDDILGKPLLEALPEAAGQGFDDLLTQVMTTGTPYTANESPVRVMVRGEFRTLYLNFMYHPMRESDGTVMGVMVVATDVTGQVEAREKVQESGQLLNAMFSQTPLGIAIFRGAEFIVELANPAVCRLWGRTPAQVIDKPLFEVLSEVAGQGFEELLEGVLQTGQPFVGTELPVILERDGQLDTVYFDFVYEPLRESDGRIERILVVATEVTEKVLARKARKESELQLNRVFEQAPVAIAILRSEQYIVQLINPGMCEIWNRTADQLLGRPVFEALPETAGQGFEELLLSVLQTGVPVTGTEVLITPFRKGVFAVAYVNFHYEPLREADGRISGIIVMATEVTEQVESRRKIEESEARFRQMAEAMPQKVWTATSDGNVNYFNQIWLDYSGLTLQELKDWGLQRIVHPDDWETTRQIWRDAMDTGQDFSIEHCFRRHDGTYRWHLTQGVAQRDDSGAIGTWIGTSNDTEEQKRFTKALEQRVADRTQALERSNLDLLQFAYVASHDMKEPLRKIQAFGNRLQTSAASKLDARENDQLDRMVSASKRMQVLIEDVLTLSTFSEQNLSFQETDLDRILSRIADDMETSIQEKHASLRVKPLPRLDAIPGQIHQLFQNLVSNALKFNDKPIPVVSVQQLPLMPEQEKTFGISVKTHVHLVVEDNGIGFAREYETQIFQLFKRLHGRTDYEGTGIGLAICKKIAENHLGHLYAESKVGEGTAFHLILPLKQ